MLTSYCVIHTYYKVRHLHFEFRKVKATGLIDEGTFYSLEAFLRSRKKLHVSGFLCFVITRLGTFERII